MFRDEDSEAVPCVECPFRGPRRRPFARVNAEDLEAIDKALRLVNGSFRAAAKLLDIDEPRFRSIVNWHLKERWGKRRGRQGKESELGFILGHFGGYFSTLSEMKARAMVLRPGERRQLLEWLGKVCQAEVSGTTPSDRIRERSDVLAWKRERARQPAMERDGGDVVMA